MPFIQYAAMQPKLRDLYAFWDEKVAARGHMPSIARIHPEALKPWLPNLIIITIKQEGQYVYRYYGNSFIEAFGIDMMGKATVDLPESQRALIEHEYEYVRTRKRPAWRVYSGDFDGEIMTWERLILPLSADGEIVDTLLVAVYEAKNAGVFDIA
jgi:hypothetical protein